MNREDIDDLVNSGILNPVIEGYCVMAMKQAGFTQAEIDRIDFNYLFDSISAEDARQATND